VVFRLYDMRTGKAEEIDTAPGGLLRQYIGSPAPHLGGLRTLLVADLIQRSAERRHDLTVLATLVIAGAGDGPADTDAAALNLRPAEQTALAAELADRLPSVISPGDIVVGTHHVRAGQVLFDGHDMGRSPVQLSGLADRGLDPLALRLAYLSARYREQADLTWDALGNADQELQRWREHVAVWAESPSKPMCAQVTGQVAAAFDDDLDTPAALQALRELEQDLEIPPGSKFESFVHADQLLGLDLPRDIGRAP
jgi:cysteinyl-tRNA synthetase